MNAEIIFGKGEEGWAAITLSSGINGEEEKEKLITLFNCLLVKPRFEVKPSSINGGKGIMTLILAPADK